MITAFLLFAVAEANLTGQPSAEPKIVLASSVAANLSTELGRPVKIPSNLGRHLVFVERHGQPARITLEALALCLRANVSDEKGELLIRRSEKDLDRVRRQQGNERASLISLRIKELEEYRRQRSRDKTLIETISSVVKERSHLEQEYFAHRIAALDQYDGRQFMPAEILLEKLVNRLGQDALAHATAAMPDVYQDRPVGGAQPLPGYGDLLAEYNESVASLRSVNPPVDIRTSIAGQSFNSPAFRAWFEKNRPVAAVRLSVTARTNHLAVSLDCFDDRGASVDGAEIESDSPEELKERYANQMLQEASSRPDRHSVALSPEAPVPVRGHLFDPTALPEWLLRAQTHEPLDLIASPTLHAIADEDATRCVVIDAQDDFWYYADFCAVSGTMDVDAFELMLRKWGLFERVVGAASAVWRPRYFDEAEVKLADRKAIERYARAYSHLGYPELRTTAKLFHDSSPVRSYMMALIVSLSTPRGEQSWNLSPCLSRLIGAISDGDWQSLESGRTMRVGDLGVSKELEQFLWEGQVKIESPNSVSDFDRHPIEIYRNTSLSETRLEVHAIRRPLYMIWKPSKEKESSGMWIGQQSIGMYGRVHYGGIPIAELQTTRYEFDENMKGYAFRQATATDITITIHLPRGCTVECSIPGHADSQSPVTAYMDLPQPLRDTLWQAGCQYAKDNYDRAKASRDKVRAGHGDGGSNLIQASAGNWR